MDNRSTAGDAEAELRQSLTRARPWGGGDMGALPGRICRRVRTVTWSTRSTACTTGPAGRACGPSPARPAVATPPSRPSSRRRGCRPGGCWSCWSRRWTATSRRSVRCGRRPGRRRGSVGAALADRRSGIGAGDRAPTPRRRRAGLLLVTGEAGIGKTRLVDTAARWRPARCSWPAVPASRCPPTCRCCRSPPSCGRRTTWTTGSG